MDLILNGQNLLIGLGLAAITSAFLYAITYPVSDIVERWLTKKRERKYLRKVVGGCRALILLGAAVAMWGVLNSYGPRLKVPDYVMKKVIRGPDAVLKDLSPVLKTDGQRVEELKLKIENLSPVK